MIKCEHCGKPVEPTREQWSTPVCWACIRPTGCEGALQDALEANASLVAQIVAELNAKADAIFMRTEFQDGEESGFRAAADHIEQKWGSRNG